MRPLSAYMKLRSHYNALWQNALHRFKKGQFEYDELIHSEYDKRFGLTVLLRPAKAVKNKIEEMLDELKAIEPDHYYYPATDLHVTVLSIISCQPNFTRDCFDAPAYTEVIGTALQGIPAFPIRFEGITASPSCIMVQGFPQDILNTIRARLRKQFKHSGLPTSIDKRYRIKTAHATVLRFCHPVQKNMLLVKTLEKFRSFNFGTMLVNELEFVFNDWYQREQRGFTIARFKLRSL